MTAEAETRGTLYLTGVAEEPSASGRCFREQDGS